MLIRWLQLTEVGLYLIYLRISVLEVTNHRNYHPFFLQSSL